MKQLFLFAAFLITLGASAQKTIHDANASVRSVKGFHGIEISGGIDLYLTQGNEEAVAVSASGTEYRDKIRTEIVNGILKIYYDTERGWRINLGNHKMKAYVSVKTMDKLTASGGSDVFVEDELKLPTLSMHISGGSDFKGKINTQQLDLSASGGSDAYISGQADQAKIEAHGGSDVHAYGLITNNCSVQASGGSDVNITANKEIDAHASGGSDILYKGTASANSVKSGGGSVKKVNR